MAAKALPCPTVLRLLLRYEPETGELFWKPRPAAFFHTTARARSWNERYAEQPAMTAKNQHGYRVGRVFDMLIPAHRAAWCITHGVWPDEIDHINGVRDDNRMVNLRDVSRAENMRNTARSTRNTSGVVGVWRDANSASWVAEIMFNGKRTEIGRYVAMRDAKIARKAAERVLGFHQNHGREA